MIKLLSKLFSKPKALEAEEKVDLYKRSTIDNYTKDTDMLVKDFNQRLGLKLKNEIYTDEKFIKEKLIKEKVPEEFHQTFIDFQLKYGGMQSNFGLNRVVWGILHTDSEWMVPNEIDAEEDDEIKGIWHIRCADVHDSDTVTIDQNGKLYWCWNEWATHYEDYFSKLLTKKDESGKV